MKLALIFAFVAVGIAVASAGLTCYTDEEKCAEDECCVKVGLGGICRKLKKEDDSCAVHPLKSLIKEHVYKYECPCAEGLKCVAKDGFMGKFRGTCQPDSSEIVEPEPEPEPEPEAE